MPGRQEIKIGRHGEISYTKSKNGWRARTLYRDLNGELVPVERSGSSKSLAKSRLEDACEERWNLATKGAYITGDTTMGTLADLWLAECENDPGISETSLGLYRQEIEPTEVKDKRATANATKIKVAFSGVKVREMNTPRADIHLATVRAHPAKAKRHRMILRGMMALAVRKGAIKENPVTDMQTIRNRKGKTVALELEQITEFRAQIRQWQRGEAIPGVPAFTTGAPRNPKIVLASDIMLGTGCRPGEALALRRCDIDRSGPTWKAHICGKIVYVKGKGHYRAPHTKTGEEGNRIVLLPNFTQESLIAEGAGCWDADDETLILCDRNGNVWNTNNFGRLWRDARGENFAWVKPKTFRATVATLINEESGLTAAQDQLGHSRGSKVTPIHYFARRRETDNTGVLNKAVGSTT